MSQNSYDYSTCTEVHPISWEDFHGISKALAFSVSHFQAEVVVPIGRGGYYPGTLIAHLLQVEIYPVRISRRTNDIVKYKAPQWFVTRPADVAQRRVVVVDEICDSGETIIKVKEKCLVLGASIRFYRLAKEYCRSTKRVPGARDSALISKISPCDGSFPSSSLSSSAAERCPLGDFYVNAGIDFKK